MSTEEQPQKKPAAGATVSSLRPLPDFYAAYADRKTSEIMTDLFGAAAAEDDTLRVSVSRIVHTHLDTIIREMIIHLTVPH